MLGSVVCIGGLKATRWLGRALDTRNPALLHYVFDARATPDVLAHIDVLAGISSGSCMGASHVHPSTFLPLSKYLDGWVKQGVARLRSKVHIQAHVELHAKRSARRHLNARSPSPGLRRPLELRPAHPSRFRTPSVSSAAFLNAIDPFVRSEAEASVLIYLLLFDICKTHPSYWLSTQCS